MCGVVPVMLASLILAAVAKAQAQVKPRASTTTAESKKPVATSPERVRELQKALLETGNDPGPIDGILGPRTKAALRKYASAPPPAALTPAQQIIAQFGKAGDRSQSP